MGTNPYDLTNDTCVALIKALDEADFAVSSWEARFIDSNMLRGSFSEKQKERCAEMIDKYDHRMEAGWRTTYAPQPKQTGPVEDDVLGDALAGGGF